MKFYLCRHGETTSDVEDRYGGEYDDSLTEKGRAQAKELAEKLAPAKVKLIYTSPKKRAQETAQILSEVLGARIEIIENLRERNNYGVLTGLTKKEAKETLPFFVKELEENSPNHKVKGSEPFLKFKERVLSSFNFIMSQTEEDCIIVTHAGPARRIIRDTIGKEIEKIGDCAYLEIENKNGKYELKNISGLVEFK